MMKKICYVVTIPCTIRAFFISQLRYLSDNGYHVTVICGNDQELQNDLGIKIKFLPIEIPRGISFLKSINSIKKLITIFKKEKFDLIQYSTPNASLYSALAAKLAGCKQRNYHCMGFRYLGFKGVKRYIFKMIEKITMNLSTTIECVSSSNLELGIKEKLFKTEKACVVFKGSTGGINLNRFDFKKRDAYRIEIRNKYHIKKNDFVFLFVGRITKDKGVNEILQSFEELSSCKLLMVGNKENVKSLDEELYEKSLKNKNIIYIGNVLDVEKYYCAGDVLLLPSYREGFGNVVIEAAAMGTPAIVSDIPGPRDACIKNKTAILIKPKNYRELKIAMSDLRNNKLKLSVMTKDSIEFIKENFDERLLNREILTRKNKLIIKEN